MKDFNWLSEKFEPREVIVHSNSEMTHEQFDAWQLRKYGYKEGDTIKYSYKQGKTTLLGNPMMNEGV